VGLRKKFVCNSFPHEFRRYLQELYAWFEYIENRRHAVAHRIPLYIPPFGIRRENLDAYNDYEARKIEALNEKDYHKYEELDSEQEKLGEFNPLMIHSYAEGPYPAAFHPQVLADWNTVFEIAQKFLALPDW